MGPNVKGDKKKCLNSEYTQVIVFEVKASNGTNIYGGSDTLASEIWPRCNF